MRTWHLPSHQFVGTRLILQFSIRPTSSVVIRSAPASFLQDSPNRSLSSIPPRCVPSGGSGPESSRDSAWNPPGRGEDLEADAPVLVRSDPPDQTDGSSRHRYVARIVERYKASSIFFL